VETLEELSVRYQNQKGSIWHNYMRIYDGYFEPIRNEVKSILEIGIAGGSSLKIWRDYFPNAMVHGIDVGVDYKKFNADRIKVHIGSQQDFCFLSDLMRKIGPVDIVIDDGGHVLQYQVCSLLYLIEWVKKGGYYIVEDVPEGNMKFWEHFTHHIAGQSGNTLELLPVFTGPINESILGFRRRL
jgi:hypothetical protein